MNMIKTIKSLPVALAAVAVLAVAPLPDGYLFAASSAIAQEKTKSKAETRKVPALSLKIHKQVQKAQEAIDLEDMVTAKAILAKALESKKINDYEKAVVWQINAQISFEEEDTPGTIRAYEQILRYKDSIPVALELNIIYGLAQLYYSVENYDKALEFVKIWEPRSLEFVGVSQLTFISQLYYIRNDFPKTIEYIDRAIALAQSLDTVEVKENWYGLKMSAHWELNQFSKVRDVLEILLVTWPKPLYWTQLAGVYMELNDDQTSYSLTEAAYKQGFLDEKEVQLVNVAQIQVARDAPIKCAWILEKAMKEKRVEENAKNLKLLGQCYMQASEYRKAVDPLKRAAGKEKDADLWFQVGQVQMQEDDLSGAIASLDKALEAFGDGKGKKTADKRFAAMMMRAQALIELKRYKEANTAFNVVNKVARKGKQKRQIRQWRDYLKAEQAREKMLRG